ncbi:MAG: hypothetical protein WC531_00610 [Candidatus Paceibacterota bacterium]
MTFTLSLWQLSSPLRSDLGEDLVAEDEVAILTGLASLHIETRDLGWLPVVWMEGVDDASGLSMVIISLDPNHPKEMGTWRPVILRTGGFNPDRRSYPQIAGGASGIFAHVYSSETKIEQAPFMIVFYVGEGELLGGVAYSAYLAEKEGKP